MTYFSYMWLNLYGKLVGIFVPSPMDPMGIGLEPRKKNKTGESARSVSASSRWVSGLFSWCVCVWGVCFGGEIYAGYCFTLFDEYIIYIYIIYIYLIIYINGFYIQRV